MPIATQARRLLDLGVGHNSGSTCLNPVTTGNRFEASAGTRQGASPRPGSTFRQRGSPHEVS
jgi:hypothetical protein